MPCRGIARKEESEDVVIERSLTFKPLGVVFDGPQGGSITHTAINDRITGLKVSHCGGIQFPLYKTRQTMNTVNKSWPITHFLICFYLFLVFI